MKSALLSYLRHLLTFLAGIGGMLAAWQLITPADVAAADAAGSQLIEPLLTLAGLLAVGVARWLMSLLPGGGTAGVGKSGSAILPLSLVGMTAGLMGSLPSCSQSQLDAVKSVPIRSCVITDYGTACYSSKSGLSVTVDAQSGK